MRLLYITCVSSWNLGQGTDYRSRSVLWFSSVRTFDFSCSLFQRGYEIICTIALYAACNDRHITFKAILKSAAGISLFKNLRIKEPAVAKIVMGHSMKIAYSYHAVRGTNFWGDTKSENILNSCPVTTCYWICSSVPSDSLCFVSANVTISGAPTNYHMHLALQSKNSTNIMVPETHWFFRSGELKSSFFVLIDVWEMWGYGFSRRLTFKSLSFTPSHQNLEYDNLNVCEIQQFQQVLCSGSVLSPLMTH
jgi:hypothetical protein